MTIFQRFAGNAAKFPNKIALVFPDQALTYADLAALSGRLVAGFARLGLRRGRHVGILLQNCPQFVVVMLAAARLGLVLVPLPPSLRAGALVTALRSGDVDCVVGWHAVLREALQDLGDDFPVRPQTRISVGGDVEGCVSLETLMAPTDTGFSPAEDGVDGDDSFILTMTSGSTGAPKPIVLTQRCKLRRSLAAQELYGVGEDDVILAATPMYHSLAQRLVLMPLILGATGVVMGNFTPANWLRTVESQGVTFTIAVSSQLEAILEAIDRHPASLASLRTLVSSSALLRTETKARLIERMNCAIHECYGASEIAIATNLGPEDAQHKLDTVGRPAPGVEVRILDENRRVLPPGEVGEIACRTPLAFAGYYKNETATRASMADGFFLTGDMGSLDEDGFLRFHGRKKEVIITGGINVYPKDVEDVLNRHPQVKDSAVIGVEDRHLGEAVLAVVEPRLGQAIDPRDLRRHCARHLADFQQPLGYEVVEALPRNGMGKVMKRVLAERYRGAELGARVRDLVRRSGSQN